MHPTSTLFQSYAPTQPGDHLLFSHIEDEQLIQSLAASAAQIDIFHHDWVILKHLERRLASYPNITIHRHVFPDTTPRYHAAFVNLPKGREFARATMFTALLALYAGGYLFATGGNNSGAKTAQTDLNAVLPTRTLATKARHRLFATQRPPNLAIQNTPWLPQQRVFTIRGVEYALYTQPGVFSYEHPDDGSLFLLEHLPSLAPGGVLLDAGCGVGIVGMVAARELAPAQVVYVDSNLLAVECVRASLPDASVFPADLTRDSLPGYAPFDLILCNPPFHQQHQQSTDFMIRFARHAPGLLKPGGQLMIVANRFLPYRDLLAKHFADVEIIAADGRYQVLKGFTPPKTASA